LCIIIKYEMNSRQASQSLTKSLNKRFISRSVAKLLRIQGGEGWSEMLRDYRDLSWRRFGEI